MNVMLALALFSILLSWLPCICTKPLRRLSQGSSGPAETMSRIMPLAKRIRSLVRRDKRQKRRSARRVNARLKEPRPRTSLRSSHRRSNWFVR